MCCSPKQYCIKKTNWNKQTIFPNLGVSHAPTAANAATVATAATTQNSLIKKAKGIRRYITDNVTLLDYQKCIETGHLRKIKQFSITRKNQRLFITAQKKRLLSDLTSKRLFFAQSKLKNFHFSVPLTGKRFFT